MSRQFYLQCKLCGFEFIANASNVLYCENCYEDRKCSNPECDNLIKHILKIDKESHYCSTKCRYCAITLKKMGPGVCFECGKMCEKRSATERCSECVSKQVKKINMKGRVFHLQCELCGQTFDAVSSNEKFCHDCLEERMCDYCGKVLDRKNS